LKGAATAAAAAAAMTREVVGAYVKDGLDVVRHKIAALCSNEC
jgi:hypothetical protein